MASNAENVSIWWRHHQLSLVCRTYLRRSTNADIVHQIDVVIWCDNLTDGPGVFPLHFSTSGGTQASGQTVTAIQGHFKASTWWVWNIRRLVQSNMYPKICYCVIHRAGAGFCCNIGYLAPPPPPPPPKKKKKNRFLIPYCSIGQCRALRKISKRFDNCNGCQGLTRIHNIWA